MWRKKNHKDNETGLASPLPTQIIGNEEFAPLPQTPDQKRVETRLFELADQNAKTLGLSRRDFLRTTGGMATAFLAFNDVFGPTFNVSAAEILETAAYKEKWPKTEFIFDAQNHHVKDSIAGPLAFRKLTGKFGLNPELIGVTPQRGDLHRANFLKEIFFDSDTVMGLISGAATGNPERYSITIEDMITTRDSINDAAGSQRMLSHGIVDPTRPGALDEATRQVEDLGIDGFKLYTGNPSGPWMFDDQDIAYPMLEHIRSLGRINISTHKGLALPGRLEPWFMPRDIPIVAKDFRDMNFIIYHSGMQHMMAQMPESFVGVDADGYIRLHGTRRRVRFHGHYTPGYLRTPAGPDHQELRLGPRDLGHRLYLVGFAAMANRGYAPLPDPRAPAGRIRLRTDHRRRPASDLR